MAEKKGPAPLSVEEYIAPFPPEKQAVLKEARKVVRAAAPNAVEKISWGMPTYHLGENLVHFAMQKNHLGFYPSPGAIEAFSKKLEGYKTTKGGVQFPLSKPIPYDLMGEITRYRVQQVEAAGKKD